MKTKWKKVIRFIAISVCGIIGLFVTPFVMSDVSMSRGSFIDEELSRMGLYADLPGFPSYKIRGFRHKWRRSRYDYTLKLSRPLSSTEILKIESLCSTSNGLLGWHHNEENKQYTLFLWDIARDYNVFLMIKPGENTAKFVYEPYERYLRLWYKENEDLFHGPV